MQDAATESGDSPIIVLTNRVEYNKQKNHIVSPVKCYLIYTLYFLKLRYPKRSTWRPVHSCNLTGSET